MYKTVVNIKDVYFRASLMGYKNVLKKKVG